MAGGRDGVDQLVRGGRVRDGGGQGVRGWSGGGVKGWGVWRSRDGVVECKVICIMITLKPIHNTRM